MPLDRVYRVLAKVDIGGRLSLTAPSGGSITVADKADGTLDVNCTDTDALRDVLRLLIERGPGFSLRNFRLLNNPLLQPVDVYIRDRQLLHWGVGRLPSIRSLSLLLRLLRGAVG